MKKIIQRLSVTTRLVAVLGMALISAAALSSSALAGPVTKFQEQARLSNNCRSARIPAVAHVHTVLDPETGIVQVDWSVGDQEHQVDLPFVATAHCTPGNKALLQKVKEDYTEQVKDTCDEFKEYIAGTKPLPEKNGQRGNIDAARTYIKNHCK